MWARKLVLHKAAPNFSLGNVSSSLWLHTLPFLFLGCGGEGLSGWPEQGAQKLPPLGPLGEKEELWAQACLRSRLGEDDKRGAFRLLQVQPSVSR